jgi:hypothetical protein
VSAADVVLRIQRGAARQAVRAAIESGDLTRGTVCEVCHKPGDDLQGHHWSHEPAAWLDVIWCHAGCHASIHAGRVPEPRTGRMYGAPHRAVLTRDAHDLGRMLVEARGTMTLRAVATAAGVAQSSLCRWETGGQYPRIESLDAVLDALHVPEEERAAFDLAWVAAQRIRAATPLAEVA